MCHELIPVYLKAADVFVLNSNYEGLSHTLLEVMWSGLPAVVTGVCGNPELIEDDVNGLTIPFNRPEKIRTAVKRILENPALAERYSEASRKKAQDFARDGIFAITETLFHEATGLK